MPDKMAVIRKRKKCHVLMKMCKNYLFFYAVGKNANKTAVKRNFVDIDLLKLHGGRREPSL